MEQVVKVMNPGGDGRADEVYHVTENTFGESAAQESVLRRKATPQPGRKVTNSNKDIRWYKFMPTSYNAQAFANNDFFSNVNERFQDLGTSQRRKMLVAASKKEISKNVLNMPDTERTEVSEVVTDRSSTRREESKDRKGSKLAKQPTKKISDMMKTQLKELTFLKSQVLSR